MKGARNTVNKKYPNQLLTLPLQKFVLKPNRYIDRIGDFIRSKKTKETDKTIKFQNVQKKADAIPLEGYKRCGLVPSNMWLSKRSELVYKKKVCNKRENINGGNGGFIFYVF